MPRKGNRRYLYEVDDDDYDYYEDEEEDSYQQQSAPDHSTVEGQLGNGRVTEDATSTSGRVNLWRCSVCTFDNPEELEACDICGIVRSSAPICSSTVSTKVKDAHKSPDPSFLARALFAPVPIQKTRRGRKTVEQIRNEWLEHLSTQRVHDYGSRISSSTLSSSWVSDIVPFNFGSPSPDDQSLSGKRNDGLKDTPQKEKLTSSIERVSACLPMENDKAGTVEQISRNFSATHLIENGEPHNRHGFKSLPLDKYKPEAWMLEGVQGSGKDLLHLVVVGHVDAGKSTLMGRVLHLLGHVTQKELHKYQRDADTLGKGSFAYAWALDEGSEERARGVTMTIAVAHFETPKFRVVLLDAPGHKDFVPNMISGASQADAAILVIDASLGAFEAGIAAEGQSCGQTREHAQLVRSLGVSQLIVAVNKLDSVGYSKERFDHILEILAPFLRQCGFKDSTLYWVPVSAFEGQNLVAKPTEVAFKSWFNGLTLIESLDKFESPVRQVSMPLRLGIAEVIRTRTLGAAGIGGKLETGAIRVGSKVRVMPSGELATIKSIEHAGKPQKIAKAGDSVDVGLQGVDPSFLIPGGVLCHPDYPVPVTNHLQLRLLVLGITVPILHGTQVILHAHNVKEPAKIVRLVSLIDSKSGSVIRKSPRCVIANQNAVVEVMLERGICIEEYAHVRALGRVVLRDSGRTLAVGIVTSIFTK